MGKMRQVFDATSEKHKEQGSLLVEIKKYIPAIVKTQKRFLSGHQTKSQIQIGAKRTALRRVSLRHDTQKPIPQPVKERKKKKSWFRREKRSR